MHRRSARWPNTQLAARHDAGTWLELWRSTYCGVRDELRVTSDHNDLGCALPFVLALAVLPSSAFSQTPVCHPIRSGETATQLARRITGDSRERVSPWFRIQSTPRPGSFRSRGPARIRPGWRACIVETIESSIVQPVTQLAKANDGAPVVASGSPRPAVTDAIHRRWSALTSRWCGLAPPWHCHSWLEVRGRLHGS